jgi:glucose/arabinose dehydrogenase
VSRRIPTATRALIPGLALALAIAGQSVMADDSAPTSAPRDAATALSAIVVDRPAAASPSTTISPAALGITLSKVASGLKSPLFVTNAGDGSGRLFIVEKGGKIKILTGGSVLPTPFLDIRTRVSKDGERGLLGLAFHPDYVTNGKFYVYYTNLKGQIVIAQFHRSATDPNRASTAATVLIRISKPFSNHNGGTLAFGPDGYLYAGTGDGGGAGDPGNRSQSLQSLLGKLLRFDVDHPTSSKPYRSPSTNPYVGRSGLDLIWARGLRNPWRFSFDSLTGDLWIGDVGQNRWEEIDRSPAAGGGGRAKNYGWHVLEGRACYKPAVGCNRAGKKPPLAVYSHSKGCSVTGGYVYRGTEYPALVGRYLFADFCSGRIWSVASQGKPTQTPTQLRDSNLMISSFGQAGDGTLYVTDLAGGGIYKIVATGP